MALVIVEDCWHEDPETGERYLGPDFGGVDVGAWRQVAHPQSGHADGSIRLIEISDSATADAVNAAQCAARRLTAPRMPRWVPPQCEGQTGVDLVKLDNWTYAKGLITQIKAAALAGGWQIEADEVFDPLPIGGSAQVYYNDWSTLATGQDITTLPEWTDVNRSAGRLLRKVAGPPTGIQIDGSTNGTFVSVKTPFSGGADQRFLLRLYSSNIVGAGWTVPMIRCAATADLGSSGGYGHGYRYRNMNNLVVTTPSGQVTLASAGTGGVDQGPYLQLDAEGSSIRAILTAGGIQYVAGPVTDTTYSTNRGYVYLLTGRNANAQPVIYYADLWDINPASGGRAAYYYARRRGA